MTEREMLEHLLKDAEAMVARIKARLAEQLSGDGVDAGVSASASAAIERVQGQKTSDDTGNY